MKTDSIILTTFNKAWLLPKTLDGIFANTKTNTELIIVIDGCTDGTEGVVDQCIKLVPKNISVKVFHTPNVFETKANNIGLKAASGDYVIIVQDDMVIAEENWNLRLRKPVETFSDVFAVTAQAAHNWEYKKNNNCEFKHHFGEWCDIIVPTEERNKKNTDRETFVLRDCVNRGPLLIDHSVLKKLNYLDESFSPQTMDDHDLCYRAFEILGKRCGLYWINYISDPSWGSTRRGFLKWLVDAVHKNNNIIFERHKQYLVNKSNKNEERELK